MIGCNLLFVRDRELRNPRLPHNQRRRWRRAWNTLGGQVDSTRCIAIFLQLRPQPPNLGFEYTYSSSQYQSLLSVLCGYYCIYFIRECDKGDDNYEIVKVLDTGN